MSGQEEQSPQDINSVDHQIDNDNYDNYERFANLLMLASAPASNSRSRMVLDYMYGNGISLVPIPIPMNGAVAGGGGGGEALDGLYDFESAAASILGRSLYDRCPVKNVITDEACLEIVDRKFTSAMVEDLKINGTCGIWQEDFKEGEDIKILPCNHAFNAEAILKWLREEKAECPMCRLSLRSKEVIPPQLQNLENSGHEQAHQVSDEAHAEIEAPQQDNPVVRVNNIAYRLAESVAGRVNHHHHHHHHHDHDHHSISVPMNRLLQNIRMSSSSLRLREPVRAAAPSSGAEQQISVAKCTLRLYNITSNRQITTLSITTTSTISTILSAITATMTTTATITTTTTNEMPQTGNKPTSKKLSDAASNSTKYHRR
jgi:hypothetical protein